MRKCYVYISVNDCRTSFFTGLTDDLRKKISNHTPVITQTKTTSSKHLVYYETFMNLKQAIKRERQLRNWKVGWKLTLIKRLNPELKALEM
ncbi:hypothetical protein NBRC110019_21310 [Neptunitalea chrysea]|uniref:GIY-YIG domain-containing protein n=1 Tax=Neptunitalea chrysea TaxID=1647581 RepID=A0A9W6EVL9_9FLAO|nr:GIY-YIG nuclease family protein [Neptunitalea chrysea]GLB53091.1 hypothetical protein NBRC110019_21310 [Neptunitalea chrysea]